ncbi:MAG: peptidase C11 [Clostridia bacterium]|nr:peptidase C11 [Clostridia bacterium]
MQGNNGNRPGGRKKFTVGGGTGVNKRGEGLGTGKVGNANYSGGSSSGKRGSIFGSGGNGGGSGPTRGGGSLIIILVVVAFLLFGGGNLFGNIFGGGGSNVPVSSVIDNNQGNNGGSGNQGGSSAALVGVPQSLIDSINGYSSADWNISQNTDTLNTEVSSSARAKRTSIVGGGKDKVLVMVYMCGTDLESKGAMGTRDLIEMTNATIGNNVHLLVYTGGCSEWQNNIVDNRANYVYEITGGGLKKIAKDDRKTMTDPATLTYFIKFAVQQYPSNRYELILWDHGGGSVSGYGYDETKKTASSMTLDNIAKALKDSGVTFDFIGFDACLMGSVETGLMLDNYADYLIASEETEPGIGWYYTGWLTKLSSNPSMPTIEIGKNIIDDFVSTCSSQCRGQPATLSLVDLAELKATVPGPMNKFYSALAAKIKNKEYSTVSKVRANTKEYAKSSKSDQIDLVDFANKLNIAESADLVKALKGAVKYNKTSSDVSDSYGISAYFPYRNVSYVNYAVNVFSKIGLSTEVQDCVKSFAAVGGSGQAVAGGSTTSLSSIFGTGGSGNTSSDISDILGSLLSGGGSSSSDPFSFLTSGLFSGRSMTVDETVEYLEDNYFEADQLKWQENKNGDQVISMTEKNWDLVTDVVFNMFYDDGKGYIDLGVDNVYELDSDNNLAIIKDKTWLSVNKQLVAYYFESMTYDDDSYTITGYIPAFVNGNRMELLVVFDSENEKGRLVGARNVYVDGETDTVAKSIETIEIGARIDFICDYYDYDGNYQDSFYLGDQMIYDGTFDLANISVGDHEVRVMYRLTDIYQQDYWTPALKF